MNKIHYTVVNEDISDDKELFLYIQRYKYPSRVYQVIRKAYDEQSEGEFIPNPIYDTKYWPVCNMLLEEYHFDPDIPAEVFAVIYRDEEHLPGDNPEVKSKAGDPCVLITYDHIDKNYLCENTGIYGNDIEDYNEQDEEALGKIVESTLRAAIDKSVALLDRLIENSLMG